MKLNITHCSKCGKDYLVGIDGKDIRKEKFDGGTLDKIPFIAIKNEVIEDSQKLPNKKIPCKNCGRLCKIIDLKPKK